jgi:hypothetical protein
MIRQESLEHVLTKLIEVYISIEGSSITSISRVSLHADQDQRGSACLSFSTRSARRGSEHPAPDVLVEQHSGGLLLGEQL